MVGNESYDPANFFETFRRALNPMIRVQEEGLNAMERLARLQLDTARDCLESSVSHARALFEAGSPAEFFKRKSELTAQFGQRLQDRTREFFELQAESGRTMGHAMEGAVSAGAQATERSAHEAQGAVIRPSSEGSRRGHESSKRPS